MNDEKTNDGVGAYKWVALALLTVGYFMQQGTRQIFNSVLPQMKAEFTSVAAGDWGTVMTVFAAVYGVCVLFAGVLGDLFSRKKTILISVSLFSLAILASGFARPFGWLSLVSYLVAVYSVVFAAGQCLYPSSANSILSQLHDKTRSMAMSIMQSALRGGRRRLARLWLARRSGTGRLALSVLGVRRLRRGSLLRAAHLPARHEAVAARGRC